MKQIEKALDLAQCELRAAYKRLGYADSNVLKLIDEALNQVKNCNIHDVSGLLLVELAMRTKTAFPFTEEEDKMWNEGLKKQMDFQKRLWDQLEVVRGSNNR